MRAVVRTAVVAGVFSAVVFGILLVDFGTREAKDPFESVEFIELKRQLAERPDDAKLIEQIRELDLELCRDYFRHRRFARFGGGLLLGGLVVMLVSARFAAILRRRLPRPEPREGAIDLETPRARAARWSVGAVVVLVGMGAFALSLGIGTELASLPDDLRVASDSGSHLPPKTGESGMASGGAGRVLEAPEPGSYATDEEFARQWPSFRGANGSGISAYDNIPTSWDGPSGEGVAWKAPVPLPGHNSPVVWGDRVFVTGATEENRRVFCFDATSGELLWAKEVPSTLTEKLTADDIMEDTGFAAPTAVVDGRHVVGMFANGDIGAFDFSGNLAWSESLGIPDNTYGHGASLAVFRNLVLVQFDQGENAKAKKSKLLALNISTGDIVYEVPREVPNSWASPVVVKRADRHQLLTCADPWAIAYNPADGSELWRADVLSGDVGPSAVAVDGLALVGNEYCELSAVRMDGEGDVSESHVVWTGEDGLSDTCSPLATSEFLFLTPYDVYCYDVKTGELLWDSYDVEAIEFDDVPISSPGWAAGRLYVVERSGICWVLEPSRETAKVIAKNALGEPCVSSPAFQNGRIYLRGEAHLFCLGEKKTPE